MRWGAFQDTDLDNFLRENKATQVVLTGIATSLGVESTARAAYDLGYNVVLVTDAMTDLNPDAHQNSLQAIFPNLGETTSTTEVIAMMDERRKS